MKGSYGSDSFIDRPLLIFMPCLHEWMNVCAAHKTLTPELAFLFTEHQVVPLRNLTAKKPVRREFLKLSTSSLLHPSLPPLEGTDMKAGISYIVVRHFLSWCLWMLDFFTPALSSNCAFALGFLYWPLSHLWRQTILPGGQCMGQNKWEWEEYP